MVDFYDTFLTMFIHFSLGAVLIVVTNLLNPVILLVNYLGQAPDVLNMDEGGVGLTAAEV